MKKIIRRFKNIGIALIIFTTQAFLMSYNVWWLSFLFPTSVVILTTFFNLNLVYYIIGIVGVGLSFFSILPFGSYVLIFGLLHINLKYLVVKFFPQSSPYSMLLCAIIGLLFYQFEVIVLNKLLYWLGIIDFGITIDSAFFHEIIIEIILSCVLIVILSAIFRLQKKYYYV